MSAATKYGWVMHEGVERFCPICRLTTMDVFERRGEYRCVKCVKKEEKRLDKYRNKWKKENSGNRLKFVNGEITLCEVLRQIQDICQTDSEKDKKIRLLIKKSSEMAKKITKKLYEYSKEYDAGWWEANPDYEELLLLRMDKVYLTE